MIKFNVTTPYIPSYATEKSHGLDIHAIDNVAIMPQQTKLIPTGLYIESIESTINYDIQIRGRSSLSARGILCSTGTIDADYRGELKVCLTNTTSEIFYISCGDRIAQIVVGHAIVLPEFKRKNNERTGGFGSTGK